MAYLYEDWAEQSTLDLMVAQLNRHISEVGALISASVGANGNSRDPTVLQAYHKTLMDERIRLEAKVGVTSPGGSGSRVRRIGFRS